MNIKHFSEVITWKFMTSCHFLSMKYAVSPILTEFNSTHTTLNAIEIAIVD